LVATGIIMVSGTVFAEVVLSYNLGNGVGSVTGNFAWNPGDNYAKAGPAGVGIVAGACTGPTQSPFTNTCFQLSSTVNGVNYVPTLAINIYTFDAIATNTGGWTVAAATSGTPAAFAGTGCAYLFVANFEVVPSDIAVSACGAAHIALTAPALSTLNAACAGSTPAIEAFDLTAAGTATPVASTGAVACTYSAANTATTPAVGLEVSYFVWSASTPAFTGTGASLTMTVSVGSSP